MAKRTKLVDVVVEEIAQQERIARIVLAASMSERFPVGSKRCRVNRIDRDVVTLQERRDQRAFSGLDGDSELTAWVLLPQLLDPLLDLASVLLECSSGLRFWRLDMPSMGSVCPVDADEDGCLSYTGVHGFLGLVRGIMLLVQSRREVLMDGLLQGGII